MPANESKEQVDVSKPETPPSVLAAFLSYLIPGLGQIVRGRVLKGIMFLVCLWGLFFYGLYLGKGRNVYFPPRNVPNHGDMALRFRGMQQPLFTIPHAPYFAQFCIGIVAWPAIIQAASYDLAEPDKSHPLFGDFERYPSLQQQEVELRNGDKTADLGWVYTIIAGLLNILVIYDAFSGPVHAQQSIRLTAMLCALVVLTVLTFGAWCVLYLMAVVGWVPRTIYFELPVVLLVVSFVYSGTRFDGWKPITLEAIHWGWRMAGFLLIIGGVLFVIGKAFA